MYDVANDYIHHHFGRWKTADRLRTDNGPDFPNDIVREIWAIVGSESIGSFPSTEVVMNIVIGHIVHPLQSILKVLGLYQ